MNNALDFLLEQANERENQAVLALNKARTELDAYYQQLQQIEKYRLDYCQQLIDRGKQGLTASQYNHLNRFLTTLDGTLSKQKQAESHFKDQVESCERNWLECRKQRRSYEWMIEKKQAEKQRLENLREQKQMDEFSTLQFARLNAKRLG
ncbi:flagellar protein FliJ [Vibrio ponticus]|uniref:Flagellar FliJ protein n=1 Tax=Vibrio ponticus TaxID=265668 RepID=A0A3N3E4F6_9VIBR|nr:flagellar export protein FliJ [Vibrio ponticus]OLQ89226.1 flagellar protein FliJ [Vibrio ponticus]ROV61607.1 flagella biosynthesis chaperone FliJ [Vibrio ponticus]